MTDTITITPEERAAMRSFAEYAEKNKKHLSSAHVAGNKKELRLLDALEAAEAEVRGVRSERDWLAGQLHGLGPKYNDVICPQEKCHATGDCIDCWQEAARRAVGCGR